MSVISKILPTYLPSATPAQKRAFFQALVCLSGVDGHTDQEEIDYINKKALACNMTDFADICNFADAHEVIKNVKIIDNRALALELIREMCTLAHVDNALSDEETLFIGKIGKAMNIEIEKIEQISQWIVEHIIWREQAKLIFEEQNINGTL